MFKKLIKKPLPNIFRSFKLFNDVRFKYEDINDAIKYISYTINEDCNDIINLLEAAGIYVPNDSKIGLKIKKFTKSLTNKYSIEQITELIAWKYCIPDEEAKRLVMCFNN